MQGTLLNDLFPAGETIVLKPLFSKPRIPIPWLSLQASIHLPHKIHFDVSLTKPGATSSKVVGVFSPTYISGLAPTLLETSKSSHCPFFLQA